MGRSFACALITAVIALLSQLYGLVVTWPGRALTFLITPIGNDGYNVSQVIKSISLLTVPR